ncbi:hypothetical protein PT285_00930 [Lactobacillus sp. ESL0791]|uniref:LiaF transmembrane domain-containing protein n=1 Tax=Lactobacillus sp. ESL0791 TaxID=2983234 RepID=UPI0023F76071|nr:hypothetical protein [Lactobacillus sp. ESL0791]MDF7638002.1 hypothetical protein [Lactobacillus sp. ESL0791]
MRRHKIKQIFWGIGLLAAAIFLVLNQLNMLSFHLGFWTVFWSIIFIAILADGIFDFSLDEIIFAVAFLLIIYAGPLKITKLVPWTILIAAVLVDAGLHLIFKKRWRPKVYINNKKVDADWSDLGTEKKFHADTIFSSNSKNEDAEDIVISQKMSEASRYIHSQNLRSVTINSLMGEVNVYLDEAKPAGDTVTVTLNSSMSGVTIYVPLSWTVDDQNLQAMFGEVEISGTSNGGGPTLLLQGSSKLGDIEVKYV